MHLGNLKTRSFENEEVENSKLDCHEDENHLEEALSPLPSVGTLLRVG